MFLSWLLAGGPPQAVFPGGAAVKPPELLGEIAGAVKAAGRGHLRDALVGAGQQDVGPLHDAVFQQVLHGRDVDGLLEAAQAFPLADAGSPGDVCQGQPVGKVLLDAGEHLLHPHFVQVGAERPRLLEIGGIVAVQGHADRRQLVPHHKFIAGTLGGQGVAGLPERLDGAGVGLPVQFEGPEGVAVQQGKDVLFGKDGVLAAGDQIGLTLK